MVFSCHHPRLGLDSSNMKEGNGSTPQGNQYSSSQNSELLYFVQYHSSLYVLCSRTTSTNQNILSMLIDFDSSCE